MSTTYYDNSPLTDEELAAIKAWKDVYGKAWKKCLHNAWMAVYYPGLDDNTASTLQRIRNQRGPSWLVNFHLPKE